MTGRPRTKAWAEARVRDAGGRPDRMTVWCLLLDRPADDWKAMSREQQETYLAPYVLEGERFHWSQEGELFIVPEATGGRGRSEHAERPLDELRLEQAQRGMFADAIGKMERAAIQRGYAEAMQGHLAMYVELEQKVLGQALKEDASPAERRMAMAAWKDMKDRLMGKPVAPVEDVTQRPSDIRKFLASAPPKALPLSASWTPESVAEDQRRALEAGELEESGFEEAG